ncbi:Predicted arabinose efflux permease, MFS family [Parafrankia irregularis]|uniref:Predicted arabinose efflux permease, MFS family n=1 Tax=Parafrankia irregularis TaxID=795642 RepID=A0A0S4QHB5_9ACTN|nr:MULTISPECIES: MFS transporter [Parafrankia]MBE3200704.1 MFS transporter [Parafrankia sp. CH37]CUU54913.1 Predicted arabinose efflux permease, MFS family [Parafrankia irregularis]
MTITPPADAAPPDHTPTGQAAGGYRLFLTARAISWTGSAISLVALPLLIYQRSGSPALTGLLTALEATPYLLLGLPAGAWADRLDPRRVLGLSALASCLLLASIPLADAAGLLTTSHLLVAAAGSATALTFSDAAGFRALAALVPPGLMGQATGRLSAVSTVIALLGPATGGLLATALGASTAIAVDAASFAVSAVLMARLPLPLTPTPGVPPAGRSLPAEIGEGLRWVWNHRLVRTLTLLGVGNSLTAGFITGLIVVVAVRHLDLPSDDGRIGLLYAAAGAGSLLASLLLPPLQRHLPVGWITLGGLAAGLLFLAGWSASRTLTLGALTLLGWQATNTLVSLNGIVIRQTVAPLELQARVNTTARIIAWGGQPAGALLGGLVTEHAGLGPALTLGSSGLALSLLTGAFTRLRHRDHLGALTPAAPRPTRAPA